MAKQQKSPDRLVKGAVGGFPRGRLIWARLFEAEAMEDGQEKSWSCAIRFDEDADLTRLRKAFAAACMDQFGTKTLPRKGHTPFIEGDELAALIEEEKVPEGTTEDMVILKLRRYEKFGPPQLWDQNVEVIESPTEMYSGCHVVADVEFYGWERTSGSKAKGVSVRLNGLQKIREDDPLGGGAVNTEDSFKKVKMEKRGSDDDDDDAPAARGKKGKSSRRSRDDDDDDDV